MKLDKKMRHWFAHHKLTIYTLLVSICLSLIFATAAKAAVPQIASCTVNPSGTSITLTFDSEISNGSLPLRTAFRINESGNLRLVRNVETTTSASTSMSIRLNAATIYQSEVISVSYINPGGINSLRNGSNEQVANFNCPSVTNNSTVSLIIALDSTTDSYSGSGDTWNDISGHGYNLNINGNPNFTSGEGFNFNQTYYTPSAGSQRYPICYNPPSAARTPCVNHAYRPTFPSIGNTWSMFAWVRPSNVSGSEQPISTMSRCPDNQLYGSDDGYNCADSELIWGISNSKLYAWDYRGQYLGARACPGSEWNCGTNFKGDNSTAWTSTTTLTNNTWYYVGIVRNTTSTTSPIRTTYSMYINGVLDNQVTTDQNPVYGNDNLNIGADWRDNARQFSGVIKSFYVYDSVVDPAVALNEYTSSLVTFSSISNQLYERNSVIANASTSSSSALIYSTSGSCSNVGSTINFTSSGECVVTASAGGGMVDRIFTIVYNLDLRTPQKIPVYPTLKNINLSPLQILTNNSQRVYMCLDLVSSENATNPLAVPNLSFNYTETPGDTLTSNSNVSLRINATLSSSRTILSTLKLNSSGDRVMKYNSGLLYLLIRANLIVNQSQDNTSCNDFDSGGRRWIKLNQIGATISTRFEIPLSK